MNMNNITITGSEAVELFSETKQDYVPVSKDFNDTDMDQFKLVEKKIGKKTHFNDVRGHYVTIIFEKDSQLYQFKEFDSKKPYGFGISVGKSQDDSMLILTDSIKTNDSVPCVPVVQRIRTVVETYYDTLTLND